MTRPLDRLGELALVLGVHAGDSARDDLSALRGEAREEPRVPPVDGQRLVDEKGVDLALGAATASASTAVAIISVAISVAISVSSTTAAAFAASICVTHLCLTS